MSLRGTDDIGHAQDPVAADLRGALDQSFLRAAV
jgi:hypothetical protein